MPIKIKIIIIMLVIGAGFVIYQSATYLTSISSDGASILKNSKLGNPDFDPDKDGLSNTEESYWNTDPYSNDTDGDGFMDGEEIASGHDPLIPGPDDILLSDENISQKLTSLALAGLYEGSLLSDSDNLESSLNSLADSIIQDAIEKMRKEVDEDKFTIVDSTQKNQEKYLGEVSNILKDFIKIYYSSVVDIGEIFSAGSKEELSKESTVNYFSNSTNELGVIFNRGVNISVPKNWSFNHSGLLNLIGDVTETNRALSKGKDDPVRATVALDRLLKFSNIVSKLTLSFAEKADSENLNKVSTIFSK